MNGVININKPSGMTSHDVVQQARRVLGEKRIGHTGTLDPLATGVLVLCIGAATRIARYLEAGEKEYAAVMRLGITTDTLDAEGRVLEKRVYAAPSREALAAAMRKFSGAIMQSPPAYSAVKISGVPSYKLARQGKTEPNKARPVTVHEIRMTAYEDPFVSLAVRCSKGVYIRSLCADIGDAVGAGSHVTSLQRTRSGRFTIAESVTLEELAEMSTAGTLDKAVTTVDEALAGFPAVSVEDAEAGRVSHGNRIACPAACANRDGALVRLRNQAGRLLAVARVNDGFLLPELVFSSGS
jgi:tRNA pseudouridine55 synthase